MRAVQPAMAGSEEPTSTRTVAFDAATTNGGLNLMNGGPVGSFSGPYLNGTSTNGTNSRVTTPRTSFTHGQFDSPPPLHSLKEPLPFPHPSPRAQTWPSSPPLTAELPPEEQEAAATQRHASHQVPTPGPHEGEAGGPRSRTYARVRTYADGAEHPRTFPRISRPVELLRANYDVVVIGSGYGGGVAASRLARTGETVCVLERGKEKWPGEYPTGSRSALGELHWSGRFAPMGTTGWEGMPVDGGDPTGMYHLIFGKGQNAVVCNGLGGTSLMNANVFLEANHDALRMKAWPKEIREHPEELDKCMFFLFLSVCLLSVCQSVTQSLSLIVLTSLLSRLQEGKGSPRSQALSSRLAQASQARIAQEASRVPQHVGQVPPRAPDHPLPQRTQQLWR